MRFGVTSNGETNIAAVGNTSLGAGYNYPYIDVIDPANGFAYYATQSNPAKIIKVALGTGTTLPSIVTSITLNSGEGDVESAGVDLTNHYAYFIAAYNYPSTVVKVDIDPSHTFQRVGALTFNTNENLPSVTLIDPAGGYGYFALSDTSNHSTIVKVNLG